jgi:hypothetical protein
MNTGCASIRSFELSGKSLPVRLAAQQKIRSVESSFRRLQLLLVARAGYRFSVNLTQFVTTILQHFVTATLSGSARK